MALASVVNSKDRGVYSNTAHPRLTPSQLPGLWGAPSWGTTSVGPPLGPPGLGGREGEHRQTRRRGELLRKSSGGKTEVGRGPSPLRACSWDSGAMMVHFGAAGPAGPPRSEPLPAREPPRRPARRLSRPEEAQIPRVAVGKGAAACLYLRHGGPR